MEIKPITINKVKRVLYPKEPMICERENCVEEFEGKVCHTVDLGEGFKFDAWFCQKCKRDFVNKFMK